MSLNSPLEAGAVLTVLLAGTHKIVLAVCLAAVALLVAAQHPPETTSMAAAEQCESSGVQEELSLQLILGTFK